MDEDADDGGSDGDAHALLLALLREEAGKAEVGAEASTCPPLSSA